MKRILSLVSVFLIVFFAIPFSVSAATCPNCNSTGKVTESKKCPQCGGKAYLPSTKDCPDCLAGIVNRDVSYKCPKCWGGPIGCIMSDCRYCNGSGIVTQIEPSICQKCNGEGTLPDQIDCDRCENGFEYYKVRCTLCNGSGIVPNEYTVTYDSNTGYGASSMPSSQKKYEGETLKLSTRVPTLYGYTFEGWSTTPTGQVEYFPGADYTEDADITLYAVWHEDNPKYYDSNSGCYYTVSNGVAAIYSCTSKSNNITIPSELGGFKVTSIGNNAFSYLSSLFSVTIPSTVTNIGDSAFENCTSLWCIHLPNSVTSIGEKAFYNCKSMTGAMIPVTVTNIGSNSFNGCNIKQLIITGNSNPVTSKIVVCKSTLEEVIIRNGVTSINDWAFYNCTSLTSITIPNSVTSIGMSAFRHCEDLKSIKIPDSVMSIGDYAFHDCSSMNEITINDNVSNIGYFAFVKTGYYTNKSNWENNVLYIGKHLITADTKISGNYTIKSNTKTIANNAFESCTSLKKIIIPDSIIHIGTKAFYGCKFKLCIIKESYAEEFAKSHGFSYEYYCLTHTIEIDKSVAPTCTENGLTEGKHCSVCGEVLIEQKSIKALGHSFDDEFTVDKKATCTENGSKSKHCSRCKVKTDTTLVLATGHTYSNWIIDKKSTCTEKGKKHKVCKNCNDVVIEYIALINHVASDWIIDKSPTCTVIGKKHKECTICKTVLESRDIATLGHTYGNWIIDKKSTCTEKGKKHKVCKNCNDVVIEYIALINHVASDWIIDKSPTCTVIGKKHKECTICKAVLESRDIATLSHTETLEWKIVKQATINESGFKRKYCTVCGTILKTETIAQLPNQTNPTNPQQPIFPTVPTDPPPITTVCKHTTIKLIGKESATYFASGYSGDKKCSVCGKIIQKGRIIAKLKLKVPSFSVSTGKKLFKIKYTKVTGATGFQVKYTIGKKTVTKTFNTAKSITKTISGLKKGSYKVQIRAFVKQGSKTAYSDWTKAKTVIVK